MTLLPWTCCLEREVKRGPLDWTAAINSLTNSETERSKPSKRQHSEKEQDVGR